jgi:hypothetical protein
MREIKSLKSAANALKRIGGEVYTINIRQHSLFESGGIAPCASSVTFHINLETEDGIQAEHCSTDLDDCVEQIRRKVVRERVRRSYHPGVA